ncbi:MAG: hypothetical protein CO095_12380 [Armatimonadetes bacterium CG_4_9_14_3_um_filter_58_7]|nr:MAG: hypothetical protein CO095_12380 [Armatimonadetes bacterium CG_4_9_14_3_um_filter_58_7]
MYSNSQNPMHPVNPVKMLYLSSYETVIIPVPHSSPNPLRCQPDSTTIRSIPNHQHGGAYMRCLGRLFLAPLLVVAGIAVYCYYTPVDEYWRARGLMKVKQTDAAIEYYRKGIKRFPASKYTPQARYELGLAYFAEKEYASAAVQLRKAIDEDPGNSKAAEAQYTVGVCCLKAGKTRKAISELNKVRQNYGAVHGLAAKSELQLAQLYFDEGHFAAAAKKASWILTNEGSNEHAAAARLLLGDIALKAKKTGNAIKHYEQVTADYPSSTEALEAQLKLAKIYRDQKKYKEAWAAYKELLHVSGQMGRQLFQDERLRTIVDEGKRLGESLLKQ